MPISAANVSLRQLAVLVAVCERGGFSAAADALHMTQSAVSQAIRSLELAMEAPLLLRTRDAARRARPVPSALGEIVLQHARAALQEVEHAVAAARAQQGQDTETLRIGSVRSIATHLVRPALEDFRRSVPHVSPTLWVGTTREVHRWLHDGVIDVALLAPVLRQPAQAIAVPIMEDPWYVVLSVSDPLAQQRRLDVQALATRPYVMADSGCEPAIWELFARGGTEPNVCGRAQSTDTLLAMVAAGVGVTLVPQLALASLESPLLHAVPLDPPATRTVTAVLTAGNAAPVAARALLDLLRSHVDGRGPRRRRAAPAATMSKPAEGASATEPPARAPKLQAEVRLQPLPDPLMRGA